ALAEAGIAPDIVCGCSIGSVVGAAYASDRLAELRDFALSLTRLNIVGLLDVNVTRGGLIDGREIVRLFHRLGVAGPIEQFARPFAAIATDLATGREVWLRDGPVEDAVRASISLPGILSPVRSRD